MSAPDWNMFKQSDDENIHAKDEQSADMQKYIILFRAKDDIGWMHGYARSRKECFGVANAKIPVHKSVSNLWICDWRNRESVPECLSGDARQGARVVQVFVDDLRKRNLKEKIPTAEKPRVRKDAFGRFIQASGLAPNGPLQAPLALAPPATTVLPSETRDVKNTPRTNKVSEEYKPPYEVLVAPEQGNDDES